MKALLQLLTEGPLRIERDKEYEYVQKPHCIYCQSQVNYGKHGYECLKCHSNRYHDQVFMKGIKTEIPEWRKYFIFDYHLPSIINS